MQKFERTGIEKLEKVILDFLRCERREDGEQPRDSFVTLTLSNEIEIVNIVNEGNSRPR